MDSYFYKKLWDFLTFKEFLSESNSMDEVFFYLHFRNLIFEGPQMVHQSSTFEVTSYVSFDILKHLITIQFQTEEVVTNELEKFIDMLKARTVLRGNVICIDAYFALKMCLQYYIQEKKLYLTKLRKAYARYSMIAGDDLDTELTFVEFREFCKGSFNHMTDLEICRVYRLAWSFGNGVATFDNFLSAADEMRILVKELHMENSASLALSHADSKI